MVRVEADKNEVRAQAMMGRMYQMGFLVSANEAEALAWYRKAADQGDQDAELAVALVYDTGSGVMKDEAEATRLYQRAGEKSLTDWQAAGGVQFASDEALTAAVQKGLLFALTELALRYETGTGYPKNDEEALKWHQKAAEQGSIGSMLAMGRLFSQGRAVPLGGDEAIKWFRKAAEQSVSSRQAGVKDAYMMYLASPK